MAPNERKVATCTITELIQEDFKIKLTKNVVTYSNFLAISINES